MVLYTVHFPPSLKAYAFQSKGCYIVLGKVVDDFGFESHKVNKNGFATLCYRYSNK